VGLVASITLAAFEGIDAVLHQNCHLPADTSIETFDFRKRPAREDETGTLGFRRKLSN
jgi:hypothetical protein